MALGATFETTLRPPRAGFWGRLWVRLALQGAVLVAIVFVAYELVERTALADASPSTLHALHLARGMVTAFLLATWSFLNVRKARLECDARLHDDMSTLESRVRERTRELEESRAFTELLFNSLRERIVVVDASGRIVKANRVAERSAGTSLVGKMRAEVFAGAVDEARVWELESIPVPGDDGAPSITIEVGRDVTERRNLEAQVRHQEKMASLGLLAAGFAHDMGNPLASLSTELELLEGEDDPAHLRQSLDVLGRHVGRMKRTLREMVDFARRRREDVTDVSIASAIADSARLVSHDRRWNRTRLVVDVPGDLPPVRMVDDHLVLVIVNLMLNAADAMPDGGTITISASAAEGRIDLRVRDTGIGMTSEVLAKAATPLFTTKAARGTGLGLSVSASVIESVGGSMSLTSAPGAGTEIAISLPASGGIDG